MTKKPESKFSKRLVTATKDKIHWTRIESWALPGIPDLHGVVPGLAFWLETKVVDLRTDKRCLSIKQMTLRPHQISWQMTYSRHGGRVYNLIHRPSSSICQLYDSASLDEGPMSPLFESDDDTAGLKMIVSYILELGH
jgi:hypothetical protein